MATASQTTPMASPGEPDAPRFPPLENGDRMTRPEFERRYDAMHEVKKAELIEGIVYMGSPVGLRRHSEPHYHLVGWLTHYSAYTSGLIGGDNGSIRLDFDNMPQPDILLMILPENGGQVRVGEDDIAEGAPELVIEVASSSVSHDLHAKLDLYRRHGAREYLVWRVRDRAFDWFALREGRFDRIEPGPDGLLRSEFFPGLWLDPAALIRGDLPTAFEVVNRGLATPEHAGFVARLARAAQGQ